LAHIFPTYFQWLLVQKKRKEKKERKNEDSFFTYIQYLVFDNHSVELVMQDKKIVLQVA
jgi:hypothetical protein